MDKFKSMREKAEEQAKAIWDFVDDYQNTDTCVERWHDTIVPFIISAFESFAREARNEALEQAAKHIRGICKSQDCENRCYHEHSIRALKNNNNGLMGKVAPL